MCLPYAANPPRDQRCALLEALNENQARLIELYESKIAALEAALTATEGEP